MTPASHTIDVRSALQQATQRDYGNLLTRPTGMLVRHQIERELLSMSEGRITWLDFSGIGMMDMSCADEVVAKLLVLLTESDPTRGGYVVFRGIGEDHLELVEDVLQHHELAAVCLCENEQPRLIGHVSDQEKRAWEAVRQHGALRPADIADEFGFGETFVAEVLETLTRRRLVRRASDGYQALDAIAGH